MPERADALLKIDAAGNWRDGHVIVVVTAHDRRCILGRASWRTVMQRHPQGEYLGGGLHEAIGACFHRSRYTVVGKTEIRVDDEDGSRIVGPTPNDRGEAIDLREFLKRRRKSGKKLFRSPGGEVFWFGRENPRPGVQEISDLWAKLSAGGIHCPDVFPFGRLDCCHHYPLSVEEPTPDEVAEVLKPTGYTYVDPDTGEEEFIQTKPRMHEVEVDALPYVGAESLAKIRDKSQHADWRNSATYQVYAKAEIPWRQ